MADRVMLVRHVARPEAIRAAESVRTELEALGIEVVTEGAAADIDLVLAMGGDGLRREEVPAGSTVTARVGSRPVRLVRVDDTPFSARLVTKFNLPVGGWRGTDA